MDSQYQLGLFHSSAEYYARFRPNYDETIIDLILGFCDKPPCIAWDLGCGTGEVALVLASKVQNVYAFDPEQAMLSEAHKKVNEARINNIHCIACKSENIPSEIPSPQLVTAADSFHWMDRKRVLNILAQRMSVNGIVCILLANLMADEESSDKMIGRGFPNENEGTIPDWKKALREILKEWCGQSSWEVPPGWPTHDEVICKSDWHVEKVCHREIWRRTIDEVVGLCLSFSWCSPEKLGNRRESFEADVRKRLLAIQPDNCFIEPTRRRILVLRRL